MLSRVTRCSVLLFVMTRFAFAQDGDVEVKEVGWHVSQVFLAAYKAYGARMRARGSLSACDLAKLGDALRVTELEQLELVTKYVDSHPDSQATPADLYSGLFNMILSYEMGFQEATKGSFHLIPAERRDQLCQGVTRLANELLDKKDSSAVEKP